MKENVSETALELATAIEKLIDRKVEERVRAAALTPSAFRVAKGISVAELAQKVTVEKRIPISKQQIHRYEAGQVSHINDKRVEIRMTAIANVLGVSVRDYINAVQNVKRGAA